MKYSNGNFRFCTKIFTAFFVGLYLLHLGLGNRISRGTTDDNFGIKWDTVDGNGKLTITPGYPPKIIFCFQILFVFFGHPKYSITTKLELVIEEILLKKVSFLPH